VQVGLQMSHPAWYTRRMKNMKNKNEKTVEVSQVNQTTGKRETVSIPASEWANAGQNRVNALIQQSVDYANKVER